MLEKTQNYSAMISPVVFKDICTSVCISNKRDFDPNINHVVIVNGKEMKYKEFLNELYNYSNNKPNFLDSKKGIWFYGTIGTGKSTLMRILAESQRFIDRGFKCVNCPTLATNYAAKGIDALNESTLNESTKPFPVERGFDEVGREQIPAKYFGNELNVMEYIFQIRYDLRNKIKTHVTTNLKKDGIKDLYGSYILDRFNEMFNYVEIKGESLR